jgi:hypothetical protein
LKNLKTVMESSKECSQLIPECERDKATRGNTAPYHILTFWLPWSISPILNNVFNVATL